MAIADDFPRIAAGLRSIEAGKQPGERVWAANELRRINCADKDAGLYTVIVDGVALTSCWAADAEEGWADVAMRDGKGRLIKTANGEELARERKRGFVQIVNVDMAYIVAHAMKGFLRLPSAIDILENCRSNLKYADGGLVDMLKTGIFGERGPEPIIPRRLSDAIKDRAKSNAPTIMTITVKTGDLMDGRIQDGTAGRIISSDSHAEKVSKW